MRAFIAIIAALIGAVAGYVVTATVGMLVLAPMAGAGDSGGTAMGIFFTLAPIGAFAGAAVGLVLALRRKPAAPVEPAPAQPRPDGEAEVVAPPAEPARRGGGQAIIAVLAVLAIGAGAYYYFFGEDTPPANYSYQARPPLLMFEVKLPKAAIVEDDFFKVKATLRSWQHTFDPEHGLVRREEGDNVVLAGEIWMYNKVDDRKVWIWPSEKCFVEFKLPYAARPYYESAFGDWRTADKIDIHPADKPVYPLQQAEALIRTRVVWP